MRFNNKDLSKFTIEHLDNRQLIINMLKHEDSIIHGDIGKTIFEDPSYEHFSSLEGMHTIHRIVLHDFNFINDDEAVQKYKKIFLKYYKSPSEYDKEVLDSVTYLRENKSLYYTSPDYDVGDKFKPIAVYDVSKNLVNLKDKINPGDRYTIIEGFSTS
jgi:hypothetical protein